MASKAVVDAVEARLAANWTRCPVKGLNLDAETPADGSPFLVVQYPVANSEQASIGAPGANLWRESGAFRLVLSMKSGSGLADGLAWAGELAALFRGKQFGGISTYAPSPPANDDRNAGGGNYCNFSLSVPYEYDLIG
jgi:hypothetical protein